MEANTAGIYSSEDEENASHHSPSGQSQDETSDDEETKERKLAAEYEMPMDDSDTESSEKRERPLTGQKDSTHESHNTRPYNNEPNQKERRYNVEGQQFWLIKTSTS